MTGNTFEEKQYIKWPEKYYHLDIDFGINFSNNGTNFVGKFVQSQLKPEVYQLMRMLFKVSNVKSMMLCCDIDVKQMPLGKIGAQEIRAAMAVLREIMRLINKNGSYNKLREASNKFYTLIPHAFGIRRPTVINSIDEVNAKSELLESLQNIQLIYGLLGAEKDEKVHPLDSIYSKLNADLEPLDKKSKEYKNIIKMSKCHGPTHTEYTLEVLDVFKVRRHGEDERLRSWDEFEERFMLWHGSRLCNYVSILSVIFFVGIFFTIY